MKFNNNLGFVKMTIFSHRMCVLELIFYTRLSQSSPARHTV